MTVVKWADVKNWFNIGAATLSIWLMIKKLRDKKYQQPNKLEYYLFSNKSVEVIMLVKNQVYQGDPNN